MRLILVRWVVLPILVLTAAALLLPLIETNFWAIRYLDFARLQLTLLMLALVILLTVFRRSSPRLWTAGLVLGMASLAYQAYRLYPYLPPLPERSVAVEACPADSRIRTMVANVKQRNETAEPLLRLVSAVAPDLLLLLETDVWWDRHLRALRDEFPYRIDHVPDDNPAYGMHLLSRYALRGASVEFFFGADTPTILSELVLPDGGTIALVALHPRPPLRWSQPTTMRDAHLLEAALLARESARPVIVFGDFNAVPWERVVRRSMRIGGLLDPRIGRGFYPTYDARSWLISWPLDQVLYQNALALLDFERLPDFGSDHYPILADLCHRPDAAAMQQPPAMAENDLAEANRSIEAARSLQQGS